MLLSKKDVYILSNQLSTTESKHLRADCDSCFGLCCVALPYVKSADFAADKDGGIPCQNLQSDFRCRIHNSLREKGYKGCSVYECFGAGQKVSQITFKGDDWNNQSIAKQMFEVFPMMQQLHEMLYYLKEALHRQETSKIHKALEELYENTLLLTNQAPEHILNLSISAHRALVNELLIQASELVRGSVKQIRKFRRKGIDYIGAKLRGTDLRGANLRGVLLIASDLKDADMRFADFIGADLRDADIRGANLTGSIFLTQAQVNAAIGDKNTKIPPNLSIPKHWQ